MAITVLTDGSVAVNTRTLSWTIPTLNTGDVVAVLAETWDQANTLNTPSGTGLSFPATPNVEISASGRIHGYAWVDEASAGGTNVVVTCSVNAGGACIHTGVLLVLPAADGYSLAATPNTAIDATVGAGTAPSVSLSGASGNVGLILIGNWNGADLASRAWLASATEDLYARSAGDSSQLFGHADLTGASTTLGLSAPTGNGYSIGAIEILKSAGGTDGTATPAVIAVTSALPAATISGAGTAAPDDVAVTVALPAPTTGAGSTASPATITTTVTLPAATLGAGSTASPAVIPISITLPAAAASGAGEGTASPDVITCTAELPAATASGGGAATPATLPLTLSFPAASAQAHATATPAVVPITLTTPAVSTGTGGTATPGTVAILAVVPNPGISAGATVDPATVALAITLAAVIASAPSADPHPITLTIRDANHTVTVTGLRTTATVNGPRTTATVREQP